MTGKELIEELNQYVGKGKKHSFSMNDVLFRGELGLLKKDIVSAVYEVGDTIFMIFSNKNYDHVMENREFGGINIRIDEVK